MLDQKYTQSEISEKLCPKFDDSKSQISTQSNIDARRIVVITSYNSASYQIDSIKWDTNAATQKFWFKERNPVTREVLKQHITVAEYLKKQYKITLSPYDAKLPLLHLTQRDQDVYLVPTLC